MKKVMNGWSDLEKKAAEKIARIEGVSVESVAKKDMEKHMSFGKRGALYRAKIV